MLKKNVLLQVELDQAKAEIRQLKAERFGKSSEKQMKVDRSNDLADPQNPVDPEMPGAERKKRGQQPDRPAPKRRDRSHLPVRVEVIDLADEEKICGCCGLPLTDLGCFPAAARGVLVVDRYSGYKAMQQVKDGNLLLAFCWAHVRRDFVRIDKGFPEMKDWALTCRTIGAA